MSIGPSGIGGVGAFGALVAGPGAPPNEEWPDAYNVSSQSVGASVTPATTSPQIQPGAAAFQQPGTENPADSAEVDASSAVAKPGPNVIEPGAVFIQPNAANPEDNRAVDASTARAGANAPNQIAGSGAWSGNYIQPGS
jgi:hypothetical protein